MSSKKNDYSDIISAIERVNKENLLDIYVPSIGKPVKFTPLTVHHQKKIIETALESVSLNPAHNSLLSSEIIADCCQDTTVSLFAIDRDPIMIGLRAQTLGTTATIQNTAGEDVKHDIKSHVDNFKNIKCPPGLLNEHEFTESGITISIQAPTTTRDDTINRNIIPTDRKDPGSKDDIKNIIGSAITYEYVKYIKYIKIDNTVVGFLDGDVKQLVSVVESLPMSISKRLIAEINKVKQFEYKFTQINSESGTLSIVTDARFYHSE